MSLEDFYEATFMFVFERAKADAVLGDAWLEDVVRYLLMKKHNTRI